MALVIALGGLTRGPGGLGLRDGVDWGIETRTAELRTASPTTDADTWRPSLAFALGWANAPDEIGRGTNATGGERLIARLGDGVTTGLRFGLDRGVVGLELELAGRLTAIHVEDELGKEFPNHGRRPFRYAMAGLLYPLAPLPAAFGGHVRPFVRGSVGGRLLSIDLDNVSDQTWYHLWTRSLGGGVRLVPTDGEFFVEARFERTWTSGRSEISSFRSDAFTAAFGVTP